MLPRGLAKRFWGVCDERQPALQMAQQIATGPLGSDRSGRRLLTTAPSESDTVLRG
jgi:hypothetical protein